MLLSILTLWIGHPRAQIQPDAPSAASADLSGPSITSLPPVIDIGDVFTIGGSGFTSGSVINFFVATAAGALDFGPFDPGSSVPESLLVFVPTSVIQGEGVVAVQVINTDEGHIASNVMLTFLQGDPAFGFPNLTAINGVGLSPHSVDPGIAVANVTTVVHPGSAVTLSGSGFDVSNGVAIDLFCDCPGGKIGPFYLGRGNPGLSASSLNFNLPSGSLGPGTGPGAFRVTNLGNFLASAAVSVPIGAQIAISRVTQSGSTITVNGAGFCDLTVINLFNLQGSTVVDLGGLNSDGSARIPLTVLNNSEFTFTLPAGSVAGPAYIQALNPPFIPFTSSGNTPAGAFNIR